MNVLGSLFHYWPAIVAATVAALVPSAPIKLGAVKEGEEDAAQR